MRRILAKLKQRLSKEYYINFKPELYTWLVIYILAVTVRDALQTLTDDVPTQ